MRVTISVGGHKAAFELPGIPEVGNSVSIQIPGAHAPWDLIVKKVEWQLSAPTTPIGSLDEIVVECEPPAGTTGFLDYARDHWVKPPKP